jgi:replication-associated recombination protein RarA
MSYQVITRRGHNLFDIMSLLQKSIRRGDKRLAGYAVCEMHPSYHRACWRRLLVIGAEDVEEPVHTELVALHDSYYKLVNGAKQPPDDCMLFQLKAAFLLCDAVKNRDTDNFIYTQYKSHKISEDEVKQSMAELKETEKIEELPDYIYDKHTLIGKRRGDTKTKFLMRENKALSPKSKQGSFFDPVPGEDYDE